MARNIRTARGEVVDFDAVIIKQRLSEAPMNIEVQRRKNLIDSKEGKARGQRKPQPVVPNGKVDHNNFVSNEPIRKAGPMSPDSIKHEAPKPPVAAAPKVEPAKAEPAPAVKPTEPTPGK